MSAWHSLQEVVERYRKRSRLPSVHFLVEESTAGSSKTWDTRKNIFSQDTNRLHNVDSLKDDSHEREREDVVERHISSYLCCYRLLCQWTQHAATEAVRYRKPSCKHTLHFVEIFPETIPFALVIGIFHADFAFWSHLRSRYNPRKFLRYGCLRRYRFHRMSDLWN